VLIKKIKESGTIEVITEAFTKEIVGNAFVTGLTYEKNKEMHTIEIGGVFIEVGYVPSNKFETLTKKDKQNRIITDPTCATNVPGIYAAGDANDSRDNQIIIAAGEGATAALSAFYYLTHAE
jgi:NADH-dependent peroxiredoxin subunit F